MAYSYTRQSTISDGDTITAAIFNNEYNQLLNSFAYSSSDASVTGHRHDGSGAQGGSIFRIGDLDFLNKIEADSANNRWGFYVQVSSAAVEQIRIQDGAVVPVTDNDIDLGTNSLEFKDAYFDGTVTTDALAVTTLSIGGVAVSSTAAELNILDGVTSTASELNILDGVTSTAAELNILDGVTATATELNLIDGVTATTAELNILDGVTSTAAELNILDGVTSTAAELNILDGVTSTAAELNVLDGITAVVGELNALDIGSTAIGTAVASKAVILDSDKDYTGIRNLTLTGDLTIGGDDLVMGTNTAGMLLIADGTNFNPTAVSSLSEISTVANDDVFIAIDTSGGGLKKVTRSAVVSGLASSGAISNVVEDTTPQLGGNLDVNGKDLITLSNATIDLAPHGTGTVVVRGNTNSGAIVLNCESNSHGQKIYGQPHSAGVTNTLMLPAGADSTLVSLVSTDTLTNKTLTSPKINEDVAVTSTATEINLLDGVTSTTAELNILDGVTSTAAELNILDGVTSTAAELNILDGVTSTAAELNALDGITAVVGELNALDLGATAVGTAIASKAVILDSNKDYTGLRNFTVSGELDAATLDISGNADIDGTLETDALSINGTAVTSTAAELNILDGVTSTAAELNILDGVTSTAAELNILDGVTSTATELNLLDGVTATTAEINYLDVATLGLTAASKAVTADANGVITLDNGFSEEYAAVTSSSNVVSLNLRTANNFSHDLTENTTISFTNPAASGKVSAATLRIIQGSTARTITWNSSIKWASDTAPTLTTTNDAVDIFVFYTVDGGTTYYGFTAGQVMS
tara:strand:+ start:4229 stop:6676 length:2448 start_codon:yes stop_codon:yes gene_type:complete